VERQQMRAEAMNRAKFALRRSERINILRAFHDCSQTFARINDALKELESCDPPHRADDSVAPSEMLSSLREREQQDTQITSATAERNFDGHTHRSIAETPDVDEAKANSTEDDAAPDAASALLDKFSRPPPNVFWACQSSARHRGDRGALGGRWGYKLSISDGIEEIQAQ
jgi:hypothetical protein